MRIVIFALIALAVLGGGGAGAYFFFLKPAEAAITDEVGANHDKHKKADKHAKTDDGHGEDDGHGDGHGGGGSGAQYVELDPLILPIIDADGVSQVLSLVIALEVKSSKVSKVESMQPKLKDAFIQDMYGVLNKHAAVKGGVVQVSVIKRRLNKISNRVMGDDEIIKDVLLQVVQQRPI